MPTEKGTDPGAGDLSEKLRESLASAALPGTPGPCVDARGREELAECAANLLFLMLAEGSPQGLSFKEVFSALERKVLLKALWAFGGHQARLADFLHMLATTLKAKLRKHKISRKCLIASTLSGLVSQAGEARRSSQEGSVGSGLKPDIDAAIERSPHPKT